VKSSVSTVVGLGIVTALFMAIMSVFYMQQIPSKADLARLESDIRNEHGLCLSTTAPLEVRLELPDGKGSRTGLNVSCVMRPDLRRRPEAVALYLERIADSVLANPDWQGRISRVTVEHVAEPKMSRTRGVDAPQASRP